MSTVKIKNVVKGDRIHAHWDTTELVALAGVMPKCQLTVHDVVGVIRHVRGDHPTAPTVMRIFVDPDGDCIEPRVRPPGCTCATDHVAIDPKHIIDDDGHGVIDVAPIPSGSTGSP